MPTINYLIMTGLELKKRRKKHDLTQTELGDNLGVTLRTIVNWERLDEIPDSKARMIELYFKNLENEVVDIPVQDAFELQHLENKNANSFAKLPNGQWLMTMPLAEFSIQAGLLDHYQDLDYMEGLAQHSIIVDNPVKGKYIAFRVSGDSMDSGGRDAILPNSIVSTRELQRQHWTSKLRFKDFPYWVIYTTQAKMPLLKEIVSHDVYKGVITCHSLNSDPGYTDFDLSLNDVQALFYVVNVYRDISKKDYY